jgi:hypothetical protein
MLWLIIIAAVVLIALGALYTYMRRDDPLRDDLEPGAERAAAEANLKGPIDFDSEFRPPRDP